MEALFEKLNNSSVHFKRLAELELGKKYAATNFQIVDTPYGKSVTCMLDEGTCVHLPKRYVHSINETEMASLNSSLVHITYRGMKMAGNGKAMHVLDFS